MKTLILIAAFVALVVGNSFAQEAPSGDFNKGYIGFRFMPTFTSFTIRSVDNGTAVTKFTMGYGYGGVIGGNFNEWVGLQGEVIYSELSQRFTDRNLERRIDLNYVHVPLLLTLNTNSSLPINFNIVAGPQIGINTGSRIRTISGETNPEVDTVTAVIAVKPADVGVAYGVGLDFLFGEVFSIDIGYRGVVGLLDISENSKSRETNQYYILDKSHVRTYAGYAGIKFRF